MTKTIKQLGYEGMYYPESKFYLFIVQCPVGYEEIMSKEDFIVGIYAQKNAIMIESHDITFSIRELSREYMKEFKRKKPFYFRFVDIHKNVINIFAINPITH